MKSMRLPLAAIFFMTYFLQGRGGGHGPSSPPDPRLTFLGNLAKCKFAPPTKLAPFARNPLLWRSHDFCGGGSRISQSGMAHEPEGCHLRIQEGTKDARLLSFIIMAAMQNIHDFAFGNNFTVCVLTFWHKHGSWFWHHDYDCKSQRNKDVHKNTKS